MSDEDKILRFPGGQPEADAAADDAGAEASPLAQALGLKLSADQEKALQVVLSGMSFVCVGIKPTGSGADFFTAVHGPAQDLTNARPHLDGVIERAYQRKGLSD